MVLQILFSIAYHFNDMVPQIHHQIADRARGASGIPVKKIILRQIGKNYACDADGCQPVRTLGMQFFPFHQQTPK